jgi:hypothetical protein
MELGKSETNTLGQFMNHMRNAVAHGRITFSSDDRELTGVTLTFEDRKNKSAPPYWRARINANHLHRFCYRLMDMIENSVS